MANFLTKKHLSRRTVLRGTGVALALPLLDAMVPATCVEWSSSTDVAFFFVTRPVSSL